MVAKFLRQLGQHRGRGRPAKPHRPISLRTLQIAPLVVQVVAAVSLVGFLSYRNGRSAVDDLSARLRSEISESIVSQIQTYLAAPRLIAQIDADALTLGSLEVDDPAALARRFWTQRQLFDPVEVSAIYLGLEDGRFTGLGFQDNQRWQVGRAGPETGGRFFSYGTAGDGTPTALVERGDAYDPTGRPWYRKAVAAGRATWSEVYVDFKEKRLKLTLARPLYDRENQLLGVLGVDFVLSHIWQFLEQLEISPNAQMFVVDRGGDLIALSSGDRPFVVRGEQVERLAAIAAPVPAVREAVRQLRQRYGTYERLAEPQQLDLKLDGQWYWVQTMPIRDPGGLTWTVVTLVPRSDFMGQIEAGAWGTVAVCVAAIAIAIATGLMAARRISQPVAELQRAARAWGQGQWQVTAAVRSPRELEDLALVFQRMAVQIADSFQRLEDHNDELKRLDRLKNEFLANTSHELRTPLNGTIGLVESTLDGSAGPLTDLQRENLAAVARSSYRLLGLVNDILDFSALDQGHLRLEPRAVAIAPELEAVLAIHQATAQAKELTLTVDLPPDLPALWVDPRRLQQILHNLIGNALKFTDRGGITIQAQLPTVRDRPEAGDPITGPLHLSIRDTGIGIPAEKLDQIFNAFEQVDGSDTRRAGGTGLGLAIARQLAIQQGGTIEVTSTVGQGTTFTLTLPTTAEQPRAVAPPLPGGDGRTVQRLLPTADRAIAPTPTNPSTEPPPEPPTPVEVMAPARSHPPDRALNPATDAAGPIWATPRDRPQGNRFTILIVDDEPINLQVLRNYLALENYRIEQAEDGPSVLSLINNGLRPDLVMLDVMMPGMSGYEVARKLRERFPTHELPILMITAKNQIADLVAGFDAGANDYLTKPASKQEVLARLKTHLQLSALNLAYSRFVPREFLNLLARDSIVDVELGDRVKKTMAVLFADIRGFTGLSEAMTPEDNLGFINAYLRRMEQAIVDSNGFIDKYIGDAIMALFDHSADQAIEAAIAMLDQLAAYNRLREDMGREAIRIGIGIDMGPLMLGTVGGTHHMDTTAIGDAVNLASRLEELTKQYGVAILVSHRILGQIENPGRYFMRFIDRLSVRGRKQPVAVYEVLNADPPDVRQLKLATSSRFEEGVMMFHRRQYRPAAARFEECLSVNPGDRAAQIYLERSVRLGFPPTEQSWELVKGKVVRYRRHYRARKLRRDRRDSAENNGSSALE
ncbi:MAG: response regulator [Cyanobacteria bacterium]|nr:response regulator [Cyanobacteriota bacterium]